jgi:hypothetical protein
MPELLDYKPGEACRKLGGLGGSGAPPHDVYNSRLRRHFLSSRGGAHDPPAREADAEKEVEGAEGAT